ncbi:MAG TPA: pentapeptide repeat-containing protein [Pyrinomonadaceae bacterium]|jgi:hypothetical protein
MAKKEHLDLLMQKVEVWNKWRNDNPKVRPNLFKANLAKVELGGDIYSKRINLTGVNLRGANLRQANLFADLSFADLRGADLTDAILSESILEGADLSDAILLGTSFLSADMWDANFSGAELFGAQFHYSDLTGANLSDADLTNAMFIETNLSNANLEASSIYGISVWNVNLDGANQSNLIITREHEPTITVDNLEIAQFIYLLLNNQKIREVIDSITSKVVLILGRFTPERKEILDAIREALRSRNYLPILFDFNKLSSRNLTETISILAHMSRFIIADITDAKSIPQELQHIVPHLPSLPILPLLQSSELEYGMFKDFMDYPWVLAPFNYNNVEDLLDSLEDKVITPAIAKLKEIEKRRT